MYEIHTQRRIKESLLATSPYIDVAELIARALCERHGPITVQNEEVVVAEYTMKPSQTHLVPTKTR